MNPANILLQIIVSLALATSSALAASSGVSVNEDCKRLVPVNQAQEVSLRGYGKISDRQWLDGSGGSVLLISCESDEKARLTLAKYLSDLQLLPCVRKLEAQSLAPGISGPVYEVQGQGDILCFRTGNEVYILAAPAFPRLVALFSQGLKGDKTRVVFAPEMEVPMWLDRWDKFGFRFYYAAPGRTPPGQTQVNYDVLQEFDFAKRMDRSGILPFVRGDEDATAEGLTADSQWDWALEAAAAKNIPIGLNLISFEVPPLWRANRYREQMEQKAPQYCGNHFGPLDSHETGIGMASLCGTTAYDTAFTMTQQIVREKGTRPNVISFLGYSEMSFNGDLFAEYGPVADTSYRSFLQEKYKTVSALSNAWGTRFGAWDEVRVPEIAEFLGWGNQALDLRGEWRIGYEKYANGKDYQPQELSKMGVVPTEGAPQQWFGETFDDSSWPAVVAPGNDVAMFLPNRPAVYRRNYQLSREWLSKNRRVWLYVWDLNMRIGNIIKIAVNGTMVGESPCDHHTPHWAAYEVTKALRAGSNQFSLRIPKGKIGYRVYLSPDEPKIYPDLGAARNARWYDFTLWQNWIRKDVVRRHLEMIRQVEPGKQIDLASPGKYADVVKQLAARYGANFHNTGYMQAFWADDLPAIMRGARLPFSLETSGPDKDLKGFKRTMGLYATEGIQAIDYFLHLGDIYWNAEIRQNLEETLPLVKMIGKYHAPEAEVAALYSTVTERLTDYPWRGSDLNTNLSSGYWRWNTRAGLIGLYESDGVTESSFASGDAARYKVIIDSNTCIMDEAMVSDIEKYVRDGGTFVTYAQTGRHTPTQKDVWPISRLTGYQVTKIDPLIPPSDLQKPDAWLVPQPRALKPVQNQKVFDGNWLQTPANGLSLKKVDRDAQDLVLWGDGSTAVGMRRIGKGCIVQVGCKFTPNRCADRIEGKPRETEVAQMEMLSQILKWKGVEPIGVKYSKEDWNIITRHYVSNNGLYDVWSIWNGSDKQPANNDLILPGYVTARWGWDVQKKAPIEIARSKIPVNLGPFEYKIFLTPRNQLAQAPLDWLHLQCGWWQGATPPASKVLMPPPPHKLSVDLSRDWAFKPLQEKEDATQYVRPGVNDSSWEKINLGIWSVTHPAARHAVLRKTFTVPGAWDNGKPSLWFATNRGRIFGENDGRVWLDGNEIYDKQQKGIVDANPNHSLTPGSTHLLTMEIHGNGTSLVGTTANAWLWYWVNPAQSINLKGRWMPGNDMLRYDAPVEIPGPYKSASLKRKILIPANQTGHNVVLSMDGDGPNGFLVNGHLVRQASMLTHFQINVTPWVRFGEENEIEIVNFDLHHGKRVDAITMDFYKPDIYP